MKSFDNRLSMKEVAARLAERTCPQNPCAACKSALTPDDIDEIRSISKEMKRISGCLFGAKNTVQGYNLRNLHRRLDAVLFWRDT